jgi:hypothetical protein
MTAERRARADRIRPYLGLQLSLARRMAELTGAPLSETTLRHTNFHRRFGLGRWTGEAAPAWRPYAEALDAAADAAAQLDVTYEMFLHAAEEGGHEPGRIAFGCFACDSPNADGSVNIHFLNLDTDAAGGPLSTAKLARRQGEVAAMVRHLRAHFPQVSHIRGRSWLYHLAAYRRIFPAAYADSRQPYDGPVTLHGNGLWGQTIDSWERIRPEVAEALTAALPAMDPQAPWKVFPLRGLATVAPIDSFARFYGLTA